MTLPVLRQIALMLGLLLIFMRPVNCIGWQPYDFKPSKYEYQIIQHDRKGLQESFYELEIKRIERENKEGEETYEVLYSTHGEIPGSKLGVESAYGLWNFNGASLTTLMLNPAYAYLFSEITLEVGASQSFLGAGTMKIRGKQTVGGHEGFLCELYHSDGGTERLSASWVINPTLALPLRSITYDKEAKVTTEITLLSYVEY